MSSKGAFSRKNAKKFAVVHRPHDDPHFHDPEVSGHVLVPVDDPKANRAQAKAKSPLTRNVVGQSTKQSRKPANDHVGEAALYGIGFDDSNYDYTQHLKPIGTDPENSFLINASKSDGKPQTSKKLNVEDLFVEPEYKESSKKSDSMFQRGVAKREYLSQQQDIEEELRGFKPDLNPALREVLEALEDEAYVVNKDIVVEKPKKKNVAEQETASSFGADETGDDDLFAELLMSGQADDADEFEQEFDEWDMENLEGYEDEHYNNELQQFQNIENLEDLQNIDYQADVARFKQHKSKAGPEDDLDSVNDFEDDGASLSAPSVEEEEEQDQLGDLPDLSASNNKNAKQKKRKDRRKKGAMSDVSGFSMSSSAIARTEALTVLDDKYDRIISGYENYEQEQEEEEEQSYQPFDMANERADFESMLDDFLDNYELESGGRKLVKKSKEIDRLKNAADEVSKGKLSQRRLKERSKGGVDGITGSLSSLKF
ncbi:LAQU0S11e01442g1_1 [Lachancea quebecensis]|uniref:LAQU0S11e01442g1_1 n=1 Tax=Lachancea quebecensis TaxID=1654605 RepID=A0A0N7MLZ4_9SACH|nr:LAQU0S11e01442g1_1 [Lachancea quebecensis]